MNQGTDLVNLSQVDGSTTALVSPLHRYKLHCQTTDKYLKLSDLTKFGPRNNNLIIYFCE